MVGSSFVQRLSQQTKSLGIREQPQWVVSRYGVRKKSVVFWGTQTKKDTWYFPKKALRHHTSQSDLPIQLGLHTWNVLCLGCYNYTTRSSIRYPPLQWYWTHPSRQYTIYSKVCLSVCLYVCLSLSLSLSHSLTDKAMTTLTYRQSTLGTSTSRTYKILITETSAVLR